MLEVNKEIVKTSFVIIGSPNSGKTTLYNWLTNSKYKTVNYPGSTVEYSVGFLSKKLRRPDTEILVLDTPGTYSLVPKSPDEVVAINALKNTLKEKEFAGILFVIDGTQIRKSSSLLQQLSLLKVPVSVVVTMSDLLQREKITLNFKQLEQDFGFKFYQFDGAEGRGLEKIAEVMSQAQPVSEGQKLVWPESLLTQNDFQKASIVRKLLGDVYSSDRQSLDAAKVKLQRIKKWTLRIDSLLMNPYLGVISFTLIMAAFFGSIFWLATPAMDFIDGLFGSAIEWILVQEWISEAVRDFFANGIVASFAAVLVFAPQIFILFLGIGFFEGSGYLARAATIVDKPLAMIGLSGRSFVPLLSGFACSVPAMMAARNISSKKERWITTFIIPLMTCSARLPVYALLVSFLMRGYSPFMAGLVFALLYVGALFFGAIIAALLHKLWPQKEVSRFAMELPLYRWPKLKIVFIQSYMKTKSYIFRAGPIIFALAALIWFSSNYPKVPGQDGVKLEQSYLGQVGQTMNPVFEPMGVDWKVGVGLVSAFAAREVFVSSLALVMNIDSEDEEVQAEGLLQVFATAKKSDGSPLFTLGSVIGLLLFFMVSLQCISTIGVSIRETGSWKFGLIQVIVFNLLGYILAVGAYQVL